MRGLLAAQYDPSIYSEGKLGKTGFKWVIKGVLMQLFNVNIRGLYTDVIIFICSTDKLSVCIQIEVVFHQAGVFWAYWSFTVVELTDLS